MYHIAPLYGPALAGQNQPCSAEARALNNLGQVAGIAWVPYLTPTGYEAWRRVGAIWSGARLIHWLSADRGSELCAINDQEAAVGFVENEVIGGIQTVPILVQGTAESSIPLSDSGLAEPVPLPGGVNNGYLAFCSPRGEAKEAVLYNLFSNSVFATIPPDEPPFSPVPKAINNANDVVGTDDHGGAFFFDGARRSTRWLRYPSISIWDLNDSGHACCMAGDQARLVNLRVPEALPPEVLEVIPPLARTAAMNVRALNNHGEVVGFEWADDGLKSRAFVYHAGVTRDLNAQIRATKWHLSQAVDINDSGQIIGTGEYEGIPTAFLLTPLTAFSRRRMELSPILRTLLQHGGFPIPPRHLAEGPGDPDPWLGWESMPGEKRDALLALALDEMAASLTAPEERERLRGTLIELAIDRLRAIRRG